MKTLNLDGQVALITGGAGAIGIALGRVPGASEPVVQLDVTDRDAFARTVADARERHGSVDILVNNAGVGSGNEAQNLPAEHWDRALDVNVRGAVNGILAVYPTMVERRQGRIVSVASLAGLVPLPLLVPYAMAKSAVVGLSTSLRFEAARYDVKVSVACPGPVDTPLLDTGGVGGAVFGGFDGRRYLTAAGGPAMSPDAFAAAVIAGRRRIVRSSRRGEPVRCRAWFGSRRGSRRG